MTAREVMVLLKTGKADNGSSATLAFSCGLSSLAMGQPTSIFLTSDGAVWGFQGSATGIAVQGFPPLSEVIEQYSQSGGRIILCSVCHQTCGIGGPQGNKLAETLPNVEFGGFPTMLELAMNGVVFTF